MKKYYTPYILIIYLVGITGHLIPATRGIMAALTPFTLLLNGFITLYLIKKEVHSRFVIWIALVFLLTFFIEVAGVNTGLIFGYYTYGETLGLKLFNTPLLIGMNWIMVITGAISISEKATDNFYLSVLLTGVITVLFDIILEPCAVVLGYWKWQGDIIPFQNYVAWFAISIVLHLLYNRLKVKMLSGQAAVYLLVQFVFFILIRAVLVQE